MPYEILYTSAPSGLKPGSSGYCTVKSSRGIPAPAVDLLESLSGYRHVFTPGSPEAGRNPVNWGHYLLRISGRTEHVLSRVSDCELDYTGRSNKLAHHMVIDAACPAGPAWLVGQPGWMIGQWDGQVEQFGTVRKAPPERRAAGRCAAWEAATGDAGWGGVLAESFLADPERKVFIIYRPDQNILPLIEEAIALLPENRRWEVTFATYGAALPKTVECAWTGVVAGSPEVQQSRRFINSLRIDLTEPLHAATGGALVGVARTGRPSRPSGSTAPSAIHRVEPVHVLSEPAQYSARSGSPPPVPVSLGEYEFAEELPPELPGRNTKKSSGVLRWIALVLLLGLFAGFTAVYLVRMRGQFAPAIASNDEPTKSSTQATPESPTHDNSDDQLPPTGSHQDRSLVPTPKAGNQQKTPAAADSTTPGANSSTAAAATTEPSKRSESPPPSGEDKATISSTSPMPTNSPSQMAAAVDGGTSSNSPPPLRPATLPSLHSVFPVERTKVSSKGDTTYTLILPPNFKSPLKSITTAAFLLPEARDGTVGLHGTTKQFFNNGQVLLMNKTAGLETSSSSIVTATIEQNQQGTMAVSYLVKDSVTDPQKFLLMFGLIFTQDGDGNSLIIHLGPEPPVVEGNVQAKANAFRLLTPERLRPLVGHLRKDHILLCDCDLSLDNQHLSLLPENTQESRWNVLSHTWDVFDAVSVSKVPTTTPEHTLIAPVICSPTADEVEQSMSAAKKQLSKGYELIENVAKGRIADNAIGALHFNASKEAPEEELASTVSAIIDLVNEDAEKQKKETMDSQAQKNIETVRRKREEEISNYAAARTRYRHEKEATKRIEAKLKLAAGKIRYMVSPVQIVSADPQKPVSHKIPDSHLVTLWTIGSSR